MVPDVAKAGTSFRGAFAYYLHDKRGLDKDGTTAERVAWTETRNLASDDLAFAQSVMIATARNADELKRAAGVKATGRKSNAHVYAFALSWRPDELPERDRDEMRRAADSALKALGAEHLQAVLVCHRETAHPHVHVIVNRVDPATGRLHTTSNDFRKLSAWAESYERERDMIVTPGRGAKREQRAQQKAEERPEAEAAPKARPDRQKPSQPPEKSRAAQLAEKQAKQRDRHKLEWVEFRALTKAERQAVYAERIDFKAIAARHRDEQRPTWSELGKRQAGERRAFYANEKRLAGIVRNAIDVVRSQQIRGLGEDRGFLSMCFNFTLNTKARRAAFAARQAAEKADLKQRSDTALMVKFDAAKAERTGRLATLAQQHGERRASLVARQDLERVQIRDEWRQLYALKDRTAELEQHADRGRSRMLQQTKQNLRYVRRLDRRLLPAARSQQEFQPVKLDFERAANQLPEAKQHPAPIVQPSSPVPTVIDPVAEWAKTPEGIRVVEKQARKAEPDSLRRSFPSPASAEPERKTEAPVRDFWTKPAAPAEQQAPNAKRDFWAATPDNRPKGETDQPECEGPKPRR